tara:strand:- start:1096 stop:2073 length:978 start_codon:yes stop_codon:yes gene_type:complete
MVTLVTGGTGFIGSNVIKKLGEQGHNIVSFDLFPPDKLTLRYLDAWNDKIQYFEGDILSEKDLEQLIGLDINKIVHAAVFTGVLPRIERSKADAILEINLMGTANLLKLARKIDIDRFLYISSGAVYGVGRSPDEILHEDSSVNPNNLYSITKYASELLTKRYSELYGFQSVSVRLSGPYGPMEKITQHRENQSLIKYWVEKALLGESIEIDDRSRNYEATYVLDTAQGIVQILDAEELSYGVYNSASGQQNTLGEIVDILQELCPGFEVREVAFSESLDAIPKGRENPTDISRLINELGFVPKYELAAGLTEYLEWQRQDLTSY